MSAVCATCGEGFEVPAAKTAKYPGWTPKECARCWRAARGGDAGAGGGSAGKSGGGARRPGVGGGRRGSTLIEENLTTTQVLARYSGGPQDGLFTDGSSTPNPGPGGWGAVWIVGGEVIARDHGHDPDTTNNRMELQAIARGLALVPEGTPVTVFSDSKLAVQTLSEWAHGWARAGWKRKGGPIKNLDLIRPLHALVLSRPDVRLEWIAAHAGNRWNEYADSLSTAHLRSEI